ncbi:DUF5320 domain-containing protein [Candidatus Gracilibacteria bacterium]|nr:DUF5320 domain-containing protein [Candidatus Gracilibacteria bacterium]
MPYLDGTGPAGQGPKTGRGFGSCSGNQQVNTLGYGRGMGMGRGRGLRCCDVGFGNVQASLEDQEKFLEGRLDAVRKLKKESNSKK